MYKFCATSFVYYFLPSVAITKSFIYSNCCGFRHNLTDGKHDIYGRNGNPVEKISDGRLLDTAPRYCNYVYGGDE